MNYSPLLILLIFLISSCNSGNGPFGTYEEYLDEISGFEVGDSVVVIGFCCVQEPEETGFHLPIYLEDQKGIVVEVNADKIKVRCRNQRWQVGSHYYSRTRFDEVCDSLGFPPGQFVNRNGHISVEDPLWDEKLAAFREVIGESDNIFDLKYQDGENFIEIEHIVVQSNPYWWRKL